MLQGVLYNTDLHFSEEYSSLYIEAGDYHHNTLVMDQRLVLLDLGATTGSHAFWPAIEGQRTVRIGQTYRVNITSYASVCGTF